MSTIGYAALEIIPTLRGASAQISRQLAPALTSAGREAGLSAGKAAGSGITAGVSKAAKESGGLLSGLEKGAAVSGSGYGKRFGSAMHETIGEYAKSIGTMMVGFMAFEKVKEFTGEVIKAGQEGAAASRLTEQAITSTGGAAHVTAGQVEELSMSLSKHDAIEATTVQSGANMLLTFKGIRNEAGKNNDIFNQAVGVMVDMAAGFAAVNGGQVDLRSSSILLGKALNDPVKGLTAMQRVGVTFTDQQKAQIKALVASGDAMDAQKVILAELKSEYGGAAHAMGDPMKQASTDWHNFEDELGRKVLPALDNVARAVSSGVVPGLEKIGSTFAAIPGPVKEAAAAWVLFTAAQKLGLGTSVLSGLTAVRVRVAAAGASVRGLAADVGLMGRTWLTAGAMSEREAGLMAAATGRTGAALAGLGKGALVIGTVAAASSGLTEKLHLNHVAMGAMLGLMAGPEGAAVGALGGAVWDLTDAIIGNSAATTTHWTPAQIAAQTRIDAMGARIDAEARGFNLTSAGAITASQSVTQFANSVKQMSDRLSGRSALRDFQAGIDALTASVKQNGRSLNIDTAAGRANQAALDNIASSALQVAQNMHGLERTRFLQRARSDFIAAAMEAGRTRDQAQRLADRLLGLNGIHARPSVQVTGISAAEAQLNAINGLMSDLSGRHANASVSVTRHVTTLGGLLGAPGSALGSTVPRGGPYADRYPYLLAPGEEVISNKNGQADRNRPLLKAINAGRLAIGGTAGFGPWGIKNPFQTGGRAGAKVPPFSYSATDQSAIVQVLQQIRDLTKQLDAHGKNKLEGLDRQAAQLNLKLAQQQLRDARNAPATALKGALSGFNIDQALGKQPTNPVATQVHDSLAQFKQQILDAGGVWTKHLRDLSTKTIAQAMAIDKDNRAIDAATTALGTQQQTLSDLTSQMDSLTSTMGQFGSSVSGNFLSTGFGLGGQSSTFQPTVDNTPALSAATDQLNAAKAHLAALSTGDGDINTRLANAFQAQSVASDVAKLQAQVDQLSQPVTTTTDSLSSLRDVLTGDTTKALAFNDALHTLSAEGLNTDLFSQLAASGDTMLATELASAGQSAVADINSLWTQRAAAAAQVAAFATQQVYGTQQAILQTQITQQNALIGKTQASLDSLNAQVATLGQRVENGAAAGVKGLQDQINAIGAAVAAIPRQLAHANK